MHNFIPSFRRSILLLLAAWLLSFSLVSAQTAPKGWHLLSPAKDSFFGINLDKAYAFLKSKDRKSKPVIVAIIDSGVDTTHEDLKGVFWRNPKEIPGNGIDDDGDGYTDDVYGWNFIGGKDGTNFKKSGAENTRVYNRFKERFAGKAIDTTLLSSDEKYLYNTWLRASKDLNMSNEEQMQVMYIEVTGKALKRHDKVIREEMGKEEYTPEQLEKFEPKTKQGKEAKYGYLTLTKMIGIEPDEKNTSTLSQIDEYVEGKKETMEAKEKPYHDYRADIIRDDYNNINDKFYGNSDVMGPGPVHGTHVTGIIAANRNNGIGMNGVADNVQIMMIRAVPDGDEYDKDIALGIFFAVDHGAKVINMSFGKYFSPEKKWVDSAIRYAEMKDVLIVHAAGNESTNLDEKEGYPSPYYLNAGGEASNFISVGASSDPSINGSLVADFSNYGKKDVDVFAPGVKIYSTIPHGNQYSSLQGTSMAAPIVTGVAALIRSYFPDLSAQQVKEAIEKSVSVPDSTVKVLKPGTKEIVPFSSLSKSGGIVDAGGAVELAYKMQQAPKKNNDKLPKSSFKNINPNQ